MPALRFITLLLLIVLSMMPAAVRAQTYSAGSTPYAWVSTSGHSTASWGGGCSGGMASGDDDITAELPLGFTFTFGSTNYTTVRIMSNGRLQFANTFCQTYTGPNIPNSNLNRTLRIYGEDLDPSAGGSVTYKSLGSAPNRQFVVTWTDVPEWNRPGSFFNLQVVLHEGGDFVYQFGSSGGHSGSKRQIGWQLTTTDYGLYSSFTNIGALAGTALRWSRPNKTISGTVYEDPNYGGGAGRSLAASAGSGLAGARVELYNAAGSFVTATTTASGGSYSFTGLAAAAYHVRVVSASVLSARSGSSSALLPVMTWRADATSGSAVAVTDFVGGTQPAAADPGNGASGSTFNTGSYVYSAGLSGTAHAVAPVTIVGSNVTGVDFGFNFGTVTNANGSGQGSLRQALLNANALGGDAGLAQAGRSAGVEHLVFMIGNGSAAPGLRSAVNLFTGGVARVAVGTALPSVTAALVIDASTQPGATTGAPVVELDGSGTAAGIAGLVVSASGSTVRGLVINRFGGAGLVLAAGTSAHVVAGNHIGSDAAGSGALGNSGHGIELRAASSIVGGTTLADRNLIAANVLSGLYLAPGANGNALLGNHIGVNAAGSGALANNTGNSSVHAGIKIDGAAATVVGGTATAARNLVGGNLRRGVLVLGSGATGTQLLGNWIGLNAAGTGALSNDHGVIVDGTAGAVTIGGSAAGAGNVIAGNAQRQLVLDGGSGHVVQGNLIGLGAAGSAPLGSSSDFAVVLNGASSSLIGGSGPGQGNAVVGGLYIGPSAATGNSVQGNSFGTDSERSTALAVGQGIFIDGSGTRFGGTGSGEGNLVRGSTVAIGVQIRGSPSSDASGVAVLGNLIWGFSARGIDLLQGGASGANANDGALTSGQPNRLMDSPVFTLATLSGGTLTIRGHVGSAPGQSLFAGARVEVFEADSSSGSAQARRWLGALVTDASGNFSGSLDGSGLTAGSSQLVATATDASAGSSEFSAAALVLNPTGVIRGTVFEDLNYGGGAGRDLATSGGTALAGARVELYDSAGAYASATTTDGGGLYTFGSLVAGSYHVRVVSSSVASSRSGATGTLRPVMTYRTQAGSGSAVAVTDFVGGTQPAAADPGAGASGTTLDTGSLQFTAGLVGTAHAVAPVTVGSGTVAGVDFGFNFSTVVNANASGQGSLRQVITNANTLGNDAALAVSGRTAGIEHVVFMIGNGSAAPGLRASVNLFAGGVATIRPGVTLAVSQPLVIDAQTQPGWSASPIVELDGSGAAAASDGLALDSGGSTVRGLIVNRWPAAGIKLGGSGGHQVQGNWIGLNSAGSAAAANASAGLRVASSLNTVGGSGPQQGNVISGNGGAGVQVDAGSSGSVIVANRIGTNVAGSAGVGNGQEGLTLFAQATVGGVAAGLGNTIAYNSGHGISVRGAVSGAVIRGNAIFSNSGLGIDLGNDGVSANDGAKTSGQPNLKMDRPLTVQAVLGPATLTVTGYVGSAANQSTFGAALVDVYEGDGDSSGSGEGRRYLGTLTTDSTGWFTGTLSTTGMVGLVAGTTQVTATATDGSGNTSEFGVNLTTTALATLSNGGFETSTVAPGSFTTYSGGATGISGWVVRRSGVDHIGSFWVAAEGSRSVDMSAGAAGGLQQTVLTVPGQTYTLVFAMAANVACGNTVKTLDVSAATASGRFTFSGAGRSNPAMGWQDQTLSFTASSEATTLIFDSQDANACGPALDHVRMVSGLVYTVSGTVFEDLNYGGGAGRSLAASGGRGVSGARVELYSGAGAFVSASTSTTGGSYRFDALQAGSYYLRVVSGSVQSTRSGASSSLPGVLTYRTSASTGSALPVTDEVGGTSPAASDPGSGSAGVAFNPATFIFTAGLTGTAQAVAALTLSSADIAGIDFGFNFSTVSHTGDSGAGSLRQVMTNANTLGDDASLAVAGRTAGIEHVVFMVGNGSAAPGLRSSINFFAGGVATIKPGSALPRVTSPLVIDAQTQPGWSSPPVLELQGGSAGAGVSGLVLGAGGSTVRGLIVNRFAVDGLVLDGGSGHRVQGNWIGLAADGRTAAGNGVEGLHLIGSAGNIIGGNTAALRNVISGNKQDGIQIDGSGSTANAIVGNAIGSNAAGDGAVPNGDEGIDINGGGATQIGGTAVGQGNLIAWNTDRGIKIDGGSGHRIQGNAIHHNGHRGIDLALAGDTASGVSANDGTRTPSAPNQAMDHPVVTRAQLRGGRLSVEGHVGSAPGQSTFAAVQVELFVADDDASGYGEGQTSLGMLVTDGQGGFSGTLTLATGTLPMGSTLSAIATDANGNSSEFSPRFGALQFDLVVNNEGDDDDHKPGDGACLTAAGVCTLRAALQEVNAWSGLAQAPAIVFDIPGCRAQGDGACRIKVGRILPSLSQRATIDATTQPGWDRETAAPVIELSGEGAPAGSAGLVLAASESSLRGLVINGFNGPGVVLAGKGGVVAGCWIGTDASGAAAAGQTGSMGHGIQVKGDAQTIGGREAADRNLIAGNAASGIRVAGGDGHLIVGNWIGLARDGLTALGNAVGVHIEGGKGTRIGLGDEGLGNRIAANERGVVVAGGRAHTIAHNAFEANLKMGIDLGDDGVSDDDGRFDPERANGAMDSPQIAAAGIDASGVKMTVFGAIGGPDGSADFAAATVDFYRAVPDDSGRGQGVQWVGRLQADDKGRFNGSFEIDASAIRIGDELTAIATSTEGDSSEFGRNWTVTTVEALTPAGFDAFDSDAAPGSASGPLRSRIAGRAGTVAVVALNADGGGLHPGFSGSVTLSWLDARDDSGAADGNCRTSWLSLGSAGSLAFDNAQRMQLQITPPATSTRVMRLRIDATGPGGSVTACSRDAFAVLPDRLVLDGASDADAATAGTLRALDNGAASGGVVHRAGRPFSLRGRALAADGTTMSGYTGSPIPTLAGCLLPAGCSPGTLGGGSVAASAGQWLHSAVSYSEVGAVLLQLVDSSWAAVDAADTPLAQRTLASGTLTVGRFVPDSLSAEVSGAGQFATANAACLASGQGTTFFGQPFAWSAVPQVTVTALNAAGATTRLWTGPLMKLTPPSATPALAASGAGDASLSSSFGTLAVTDLGLGRALLVASATDRFVLELPTGQVQPRTLPGWAWSLGIADASESALAGNPTLVASASQSAVGFDLGAGFDSGRLSLAAAFGDARSGVRPLLQLQRWTSAGWVTMTEDRGCITLAPQNLGIESPSGAFAGGQACASPMTAAVTTTGGRAWLSLPASPGGAPGRQALRLAGEGAAGHSCDAGGATAPLVPLTQGWLTGGPGAAGPLALATWGAPGRDLVLRRETW
jgi:choice-of-anchor C domain-containing protein